MARMDCLTHLLPTLFTLACIVQYLICQANKFYMGDDWRPKKLGKADGEEFRQGGR